MALGKTNKYAVIVAGGSGVRMGASAPKQFLELDGIPILERTISRFVEAVPGITIVTVLPADYTDTWKRLCTSRSFDCPQIIAEGGLTRFHSVRSALSKIPGGATVAIHDGVRPLVSETLIREMFARMEDGRRALVPVLPVTDSLKTLHRSPDGALFAPEGVPDPDRSNIYAVQTPQLFASSDIKAAYTQAYDTCFTDDASVARRYGIPLTYIAGERTNIKITTPDDLPIAGAFLSLR